MEACCRIQRNTVEKRLRNNRGLPNFNVNFYVVNTKGDFAGVALYPGPRFAVCTEEGARTVPCDALLTGSPND